jgi:hypothetical protein
MPIVFLDRIDAAPLENDQLSYPFKAWIANTVDTLNEVENNVQDQLNGAGLATFITPLTAAQINALINMNAQPVLQIGSLWFDTTAGKLRVLTTPAVYGVSNGVTQLVTSV